MSYGSTFLFECYKRSLKWTGHLFLTSELWLRCAEHAIQLEAENKRLREFVQRTPVWDAYIDEYWDSENDRLSDALKEGG